MEQMNHSAISNSPSENNITSLFHTFTSIPFNGHNNVSNHSHNGSTSQTSSAAAVALQQQHCTLVQFVFEGVLQGTISLVCFIVNSLTIATFSLARPFNAASFSLIVLAAFDIAVVSTQLALTCLPAICGYLNQCKHYTSFTLIYVQEYLFAVESFLRQVTIYVVTQVAIHRYIAVCHPHVIKRFANIKAVSIQTAVIVAFSAAFNTPKLFERAPNVSNGKLTLGYSTMGLNPVYQLLYSAVLYYVVLYAVPFVALVYPTYKLIVALRGFYARREQTTSALKRENAFTKALVVMVIVCVICQTSNPIRR